MAAAAALASPSARAGEPTAAELQHAKELFAEAEKATEAKNFQKARDLLLEVAKIKETPGVVFHTANCDEQLGHLTAALRGFERAEALATAQGIDQVKDLTPPRLAALRERVPRLAVKLPPDVPSAEVRLDGAEVAAKELGEVRLDPGKHTVEATAPGRRPFTKAIDLEERAAVTIAVSLPSEAGAPAPMAASPAAGASADAAPSGGGVPMASILLGGGAIALIAGGVVAFAVAGSQNADGEAACASPASCDPGARDSVQTLDRVALGLWIGGAVCAGAAVTLWATAPEPAAPAAALRAGPGSLSVVGSF